MTRWSDGEFRFTTASGKPILPPTAAVVDEPGTTDLRGVLAETQEITARTPLARDAGHRIDLGYAISVLLDACAFRQRAMEVGTTSPPARRPSECDPVADLPSRAR